MKRLVLVVVGGLLTAACAGVAPFTAGVISTINTIGVGEQRILVELRNDEGRPFETEVVPNATLRNEDGSPLGVYPGELVRISDVEPAYAFVVQIPEAETYQLTIDGGELGETPPAGFVAVEETIQVAAGEQAPPVAGGPVDGPALLVFASPNWCPSGSCQPMIDQVEETVAGTEVPWRLVEVFANPGVEAEEDLVLSDAVDTWGLPSQPWLYAIAGDGTVSALFEGAASDDELADAVATLSS